MSSGQHKLISVINWLFFVLYLVGQSNLDLYNPDISLNCSIENILLKPSAFPHINSFEKMISGHKRMSPSSEYFGQLNYVTKRL